MSTQAQVDTKNASVKTYPYGGITVQLETIDEALKQLPEQQANQAGVFVDSSGRVFVRTMIAAPGLNKHGWELEPDFIPNNIGSIKGIPLTFMRQRVKVSPNKEYVNDPHPTIDGAPWNYNEAFQRGYTIGHYVDYEKKPDVYGIWHGIAEVTHPKAKEYFKDLLQAKNAALVPLLVSPQVLHPTTQNGRPFTDWWFQHITITDDPAYPAQFAKITASCVGDENQCLPQLKMAGPMPLVVTQIVDASECDICVKDALKEIVGDPQTIEKVNSSLMTKSASFGNTMSANPDNSGGVAATGAVGAGNTNSSTSSTNADTGKPAIAATETTQKQTTYGALNLTEQSKNNPQSHSGILDAANIGAQAQLLVQAEIQKVLGPYIEKMLAANTQQNASTNASGNNKEANSKGKETKVEGKEPAKDEDKPTGDGNGGGNETENNLTLTPREKLLLEKIEKTNRTVEAQNKLIEDLQDGDKRRRVEMTLLGFNEGKQYLDEKGVFQEDKFKTAVDYWMAKKIAPEKIPEELKQMVELVGGGSASANSGGGGCSCGASHNSSATSGTSTQPSTQSAYASNAKIVGVPEIGVNEKGNEANASEESIETKNASMNQVLIDDLYYVQLNKRIVQRSNAVGEVF